MKSERSLLAFSAFVLGLLGFFPIFGVLAIILGLIARHQKESISENQKLAARAIKLGASWLIFLALIFIFGYWRD